ncbi:hypothetical protein DV515_00007726 [Chloebia gouldiae]|uniref:Uncharacterized protein n=1 Tax=Chloebia gouldiae TaxID=44316 RepID=A0A3L8SHG4_CHLGU|nr:hypothetical protein DV515_00007726 [Chloebia gouldiae]
MQCVAADVFDHCCSGMGGQEALALFSLPSSYFTLERHITTLFQVVMEQAGQNSTVEPSPSDFTSKYRFFFSLKPTWRDQPKEKSPALDSRDSDYEPSTILQVKESGRELLQCLFAAKLMTFYIKKEQGGERKQKPSILQPSEINIFALVAKGWENVMGELSLANNLCLMQCFSAAIVIFNAIVLAAGLTTVLSQGFQSIPLFIFSLLPVDERRLNLQLCAHVSEVSKTNLSPKPRMLLLGRVSALKCKLLSKLPLCPTPPAASLLQGLPAVFCELELFLSCPLVHSHAWDSSFDVTQLFNTTPTPGISGLQRCAQAYNHTPGVLPGVLSILDSCWPQGQPAPQQELAQCSVLSEDRIQRKTGSNKLVQEVATVL